MPKPLSLCAVLFAIAVPLAQPLPIKVRDNYTLRPIPSVYLYDSDGGIDSTDAGGRVILHELQDESTVLFKHRLYKSAEFTWSTLKKNKTVSLVPLEESAEKPAAETTRFPENRDSIPNKVMRLQKTDIALYNPQTVSDLLVASDEVFIRKTGQAAGSPILRGFTANSLAFTLDGVRMNNAMYRSDHVQQLMNLDPNILESAEVVAGPGSTLYGSDAMGGVFNFHFRKPDLSPDGSLQKSGTAMGRVAFANNEKTGSANFSVSRKNLGSFTAISFSDFGDLRMGNDTLPPLPVDTPSYYNEYRRMYFIQGNTLAHNADPAIQEKSGYRLFNVLEKLFMVVDDKISLDGSLYFSTTGQVPRYDKLIETYGPDSALKFADWYDGPQRWLFSKVALDYTKSQKYFSAAKLTLAYQNFSGSTHRRFRASDLLNNDAAWVHVFSATADCKKPLGERSELTYGIETAYNSVRSAADSENISTGRITRTETLYPDGGNNYLTGDIYGYYKTRWNPMVMSVAGARYSWIFFQSSQKTTLSNMPTGATKITTGAPSGCLGIIVQPFDFWRLTLNGSTGFRAPAIGDFGNAAGDRRVLNDDLHPEYVYSLDFGNHVELGKFIGLEATTFISRAQDLLVEELIAFNGYRIPALSNKGSATIGGGNINLAIHFTSNVSLKNSVTFTAGLDSTQKPLYTVPPLYGATHFLFKISRIKGDFYMRYSGKKTKGIQATNMAVPDDQVYLYPVDRNGDYFSPSWFTLNLATTTLLTGFLDLNAGVENILNKCYRPYANGIAAPGFNLVVSIRGKI